MKRNGSGNRENHRFAEVYNNLALYPTLADVAAHLGIAYQTVRNKAVILRKRYKNGEAVPELVSRENLTNSDRKKNARKKEQLSAAEMAEQRAQELTQDMHRLFQGSNYPVINPEAMHVAPGITAHRDRKGRVVHRVGEPRTWLTDTLRVAPVKDARNRTFIFTGAQNDTPIHEGFWRNLNAYANAIGAEVVVGPWTYETNWWIENNPASRHYASQIRDQLCFGQMEIGENFIFAGEMNTLPTAARPINDLTTYTRGRWGVFPHSRIQLLSVPAANPAEQAFQIMTTGAVTIPQVIPRKAGIKSLSFHAIGATIVEFDQDGDMPFCRQILAEEDGTFQDLDAVVRNGRVSRNNPVEAVTTADLHLAKLGSKNALSTFGFDYRTGKERKGSLLETLKPRWLFLHDIHDHESRNHHHQDDVSHAFEMAHRGRESVREEVERSAFFLEYLRDRVKNVKVVESNHDLALERYVREGRYRGDGTNHIFGLELDKAYHEWRVQVADALDAEESPAKFSLLEWAVRHVAQRDLDHVSWVYDNDTFILNGVQLGFHGFRGANGAKGTVTGFARMGHKITIGDKHSPQILDRVYTAGVMELEHGYNKGPSGWATSHVVQYPNGHRVLITMQKGKWRADIS